MTAQNTSVKNGWVIMKGKDNTLIHKAKTKKYNLY